MIIPVVLSFALIDWILLQYISGDAIILVGLFIAVQVIGLFILAQEIT